MFEPENIFNADETGLWYRTMPNKTITHSGDIAPKGVKTHKDRITVLVACSATGEKLQVLVIEKYKNPRCFKGWEKAPGRGRLLYVGEYPVPPTRVIF